MESTASNPGLELGNKRKREKAISATVTALNTMQSMSAEITVSSVARAAGVSRTFIYKNQELRSAVTKAQRVVNAASKEHVTLTVVAQEMERRHAETTLLAAEIKRLRRQIAHQKAEIVDLKRTEARWLGSRLEDLTTLQPDIDQIESRLAEALAERDAATKESVRLAQKNQRLERTLEASRTALKIELNGQSNQPKTPKSNVLQWRPPPSTS